jgi:predicted Zn-dependent protease
MKGDKGQQYQQMVGSLQTILFDQGLDKSMEFEADMTAMDIVYRTGYDPSGLIRVLNTLQAKEAMAQKSGSWFSTHPPLSERISKSMTTLNSYPNYKSMSTVKGRFNQYVR